MQQWGGLKVCMLRTAIGESYSSRRGAAPAGTAECQAQEGSRDTMGGSGNRPAAPTAALLSQTQSESPCLLGSFGLSPRQSGVGTRESFPPHPTFQPKWGHLSLVNLLLGFSKTSALCRIWCHCFLLLSIKTQGWHRVSPSLLVPECFVNHLSYIVKCFSIKLFSWNGF